MTRPEELLGRFKFRVVMWQEQHQRRQPTTVTSKQFKLAGGASVSAPTTSSRRVPQAPGTRSAGGIIGPTPLAYAGMPVTSTLSAFESSLRRGLTYQLHWHSAGTVTVTARTDPCRQRQAACAEGPFQVGVRLRVGGRPSRRCSLTPTGTSSSLSWGPCQCVLSGLILAKKSVN